LSEVLAHNSTLINLSLWGTRCLIQRFSSLLTRKPKYLLFKENKMETEGAKHLGEALKQNTTLAIIDMGCACCSQILTTIMLTNNQTVNSLREEGIQFLSNALTVNSTLTHLNIGCT